MSSDDTESDVAGEPESVSEDDGWDTAEDFNGNEEASYDEFAGAWDLWKERDVLQGDVELTVGFHFERGDAVTFSFLNVIIEVSTTDSVASTDLRRMHGSRAVELRYYVHNNTFPQMDRSSVFTFTTANRQLGDEINMRARADSDEDKAQELPKMRTIYKHAAVTIVAAVARSAQDGFLHHIDPEPAYFIEPVTMPLRLDNEGFADLVISYPADYKRWRDPINSRAWTFQELILSMRAIQFSYRGVETIDRTNIPSAAGLTSGKDPQLPNLGWNGKMLSLESDPENTRQVWLSLRAEYSRRSLSYQGDKLLAIAAIAEEVGRTYNSRYFAGLWDRDLVMDLQWARSREWDSSSLATRDPRNQTFVAPSWSWASIDTAIQDFDYVAEGQGNAGGRGLRDLCGFEVLSCKVELTVPGFEYGAVKAGTLVVKGVVYVMIWRPYTDKKSKISNQSDGRLLRQRDDTASFDDSYGDTGLLDAIDLELHDGSSVTCLATRRVEHRRGREDVEGLMLLPVDSTRYRRVGFFTFTRQQSWTEIEAKVITIV
ncbi:hypothetical protein N0V86_007747 [Didymella sp. IMI 355093]|nr:hypothetical protein N0V86_007747 [Didymella sp. IMI 355093]